MTRTVDQHDRETVYSQPHRRRSPYLERKLASDAPAGPVPMMRTSTWALALVSLGLVLMTTKQCFDRAGRRTGEIYKGGSASSAISVT